MMINLDRFSDDELRIIQPEISKWDGENSEYLCLLIHDKRLNKLWKECLAERLNISLDSLRQSLEFLIERAIYKELNMLPYFIEDNKEAIAKITNKIRWNIIQEAQEVIKERLKVTKPGFKVLFKEYAQLMLQGGQEQALKRLQEQPYICLSFIRWLHQTGNYEGSLIKELHLALQEKFKGFNPNNDLDEYFAHKLTEDNPDIHNGELLNRLGEQMADAARIEFLEEAAKW